MDTLLILLGLLLILAGYVWLIVQAFGRSLFWGIGSLLPPLALVFMLRHWARARHAIGLGALGCIPLVVGLTLLAAQDAARLEAILRLEWLHPEQPARPDLAIRLNGELNGKPFVPEQAELIDGVLSLREGEDFYAHREVQVRLLAPVDGPLRLDVLPDDPGKLPEVEVSWLAPGQDLPEAIRLTRGYSLHLDLTPEAPNRMKGIFHLVLPAQMQTTLSGQVELYTNHLRYRDGEVDTRHDSQDTLAYVVRDYLQRRFSRRDIELGQLPRLEIRHSKLDVPVSFRVGDEPQELQLELVKSETRGWGVQDDRYPKLPDLPPAPSRPSESALSVAPSRPANVPETGLITLQRLQAAPQRFTNRAMRVQTERGRLAEGVFVGLDHDGRLVIRHVMSGAGEASYILRPSEVVSIELLAH
ncbi:MFS transporter [Pseudomonas sp. ZM23]|uniref:MFS transporter n=1 Tax=Pseudomonas triclosanedens TaxID=2961893 RepID=A0ABY6ZU72_9PSED|nr:MFS transporter [Pseudomonas triclosanedens]MCP8467152.1 MFS transporter [Pseudomonas triclosanedens]MCP8472699.1 MFS transporter [Pseudomonas triclosanedens]MCP8478130.1 MFS transporter [Pseudomonas triclosanedens]WAI47538.1 MFS transporter [Pseudomonas triclosanedens]